MKKTPLLVPAQGPGHYRHLIIGTGFSGLAAAARLLEDGKDDLVLLDRAADVGGCWRDNTYPGIQCDIQSVVYSLSFAPNADWSRDFPLGNEIHAYLRRFADDRGLRRFIDFGTNVRGLEWDAATERWGVDTSRGRYTADLVFSGHGALSEPKIPKLPGLEDFQGPTFHSAKWDHGVDLAGKKVAVIGTGASAIQIIPELAKTVGQLHVFQRTPPWIMPRNDGPIGTTRRAAYRRLPFLQKLARGLKFVQLEARILGIMTRPELLKLGESISRRHLRQQVEDPALREALTPDYEMVCKRVLLSDEYYPALCQDNVELVAGGAKGFTAEGVIGADGEVREVDVIVLCTGFEVASHPFFHMVRGRESQTLFERWQSAEDSWMGITVPGFPNFFLLATGPHTGLGHNSIVYILESQLAWIREALAAMDEAGADVLEVRERDARDFTEEMQRRLDGSVWNSGCTSFYLDEQGRNIGIWPGFATSYRRATAHFQADHFEMRPRRADSDGSRRAEATA